MATFAELTARRELQKFEPVLQRSQLPERQFYAFPRLANWISRELPNAYSDRNLEVSPLEQVDVMLTKYCAGEPLIFGEQFKILRPGIDGIWELKTADVRIFGWFYRRDWFVGVSADTKFRIKQSGMYKGYQSEAVRWRGQLDLDEPKWIEGENPNDVVSNCYFSSP